MPEPIHDKFLHRFKGKVKFGFGSFGVLPPVHFEEALPRIDLAHLPGDEVEKVVDDTDLICSRHRWPSRKLLQEPARGARSARISGGFKVRDTGRALATELTIGDILQSGRPTASASAQGSD